MAITTKDIVDFIWSPACNAAARQEIVQALNSQRKIASSQASRKFERGDDVEFTSKYGQKVAGVVTKVNRMSIHVTSTSGTKWRVSPQFLKLTIE